MIQYFISQSYICSVQTGKKAYRFHVENKKNVWYFPKAASLPLDEYCENINHLGHYHIPLRKKDKFVYIPFIPLKGLPS